MTSLGSYWQVDMLTKSKDVDNTEHETVLVTNLNFYPQNIVSSTKFLSESCLVFVCIVYLKDKGYKPFIVCPCVLGFCSKEYSCSDCVENMKFTYNSFTAPTSQTPRLKSSHTGLQTVDLLVLV